MKYPSYLMNRGNELWNTHPFCTELREGTLSNNAMAYYLAAIGLLCRDTPKHLERGAKAAMREGFPELSQFLLKKIEEETNHDLWAEEDMKSLKNPQLENHKAKQSAALSQHLAWIHSIADSEALKYLAYLYTAETVTAELGPRFVSIAASNSGIETSKTTVISKHVELDAFHSAEGAEWIQYYLDRVKVEKPEEEIQYSIDQTFAFLKALWLEALSYAEEAQFVPQKAKENERMATL